MKMDHSKNPMSVLRKTLAAFHDGEEGAALTEYVIIFSLISFGATMALISTAVYVKAYRDFLVFWLTHPAV